MKNEKNIFGYLRIVFIFLTLFLVIPFAVNAKEYRSPEVKFFNTDNFTVDKSFMAFDEAFTGGVSVVVCDLDGNGYEEIIVGAGSNGGPQVRVFDSLGKDKFTPGFFAYDLSFRGGVNVACGDLDNDGFGEIITSTKSGTPHVRTFNRYGQPIFTPGFFAYDMSMTGGVNIAVGDLDGDGWNEIITAPASKGEPRVNVFNRYGRKLDYDIFPFHHEFKGGVSLAVANIDGNRDALVTGVQSEDISWIKVFTTNNSQSPIGNFLGFDKGFKGGVNISTGDLDNDGVDEVVVAAGEGGGPHVRIFELNGQVKNGNFFAFEDSFRGGVLVSVGDVNRDGQDEIVIAPGKKKYIHGLVSKIIVDLSEQKLYAYEGNRLIKSFLVSTGVPGMDTRIGNFTISQKIYSKLYSGEDYYFPNTLWNMRFDGPRLLHGAYWHNNFGNKMSHGCVNIAYKNAEWLYNHTPMGVEVIVKK